MHSYTHSARHERQQQTDDDSWRKIFYPHSHIELFHPIEVNVLLFFGVYQNFRYAQCAELKVQETSFT